MIVQKVVRTVAISVLASLAGVLVKKVFGDSQTKRHDKAGVAVRKGEDAIRNAGPEAMRTPPKRWSQTDEASDQSFPASDATAKY